MLLKILVLVGIMMWNIIISHVIEHHYYINKLLLIDDKNALMRTHPHSSQMIIVRQSKAMDSLLGPKCTEFICINLLLAHYVLFRRIGWKYSNEEFAFGFKESLLIYFGQDSTWPLYNFLVLIWSLSKVVVIDLESILITIQWMLHFKNIELTSIRLVEPY